MKKFLAITLALALMVASAIPSFAVATANPPEEKVLFEYDLTKITQEEQVIYHESSPEGEITVTATKPHYRGSVGESTVTTTKSVAGGALQFVLETDFWFNSGANTTGWSSAESSVIVDGNITVYDIAEPSGTQPSVTIGNHWTKVQAAWMFKSIVGNKSTGTIWNKLTSTGDFSESL